MIYSRTEVTARRLLAPVIQTGSPIQVTGRANLKQAADTVPGRITVNNQAEINVNFYSSLSDYKFAEPYAVLRNSEVNCILERCDTWVNAIATRPNLLDILGDNITVHIKMVTALRVAVKESLQAGIFPNVILSPNDFRETMNFLAEIRTHCVAEVA